MGEDRTDRPSRDLDRLTVAQAADELGVSQDAVRKRIRRGTLRSDKWDDGRVYVYLSPSETVHKTDQDTAQDAASKTVQDTYIRSLEDQIAFLRRELERKDAILLNLTERLPQLEAPQEATEAPQTVEEGPERAEPRSTASEAQEASERPQQPGGWRAPVDKLPWGHSVLGVIAVAVASGVSSTPWWADLWIPSGFLRGLEFDELMRTLLGFESLEWIVPGIFGFWVGLKRRNLSLWRDLVPSGIVVAAIMALVAIVVTGLAYERVPNTNDLIGIVVLGPIPTLIFYVSGATIGRALQRGTARTYARLTPDTEVAPSAPRSTTPGDSWSPRKQAILGFTGTLIAAFLSLFAQVIGAILASGG